MVILSAGVLYLRATDACAQGTQDTARSLSDSGLTLSAEVFCSITKLRTAMVRLRWSLSADARSATRLARLVNAKQTLDTTVYAGGFEKGLYVSLPVPSGSALGRVAAIAPVAQAAQPRQTPRAFQIRLVEAGPAPATAVAADSGEFIAVIEDLEPGVNYTWRLTIETASGMLVSAPVMVQAPACPADIAEPSKVPPKKVPPRRRR